jgi:hypothetical protein
MVFQDLDPFLNVGAMTTFRESEAESPPSKSDHINGVRLE